MSLTERDGTPGVSPRTKQGLTSRKTSLPERTQDVPLAERSPRAGREHERGGCRNTACELVPLERGGEAGRDFNRAPALVGLQFPTLARPVNLSFDTNLGCVDVSEIEIAPGEAEQLGEPRASHCGESEESPSRFRRRRERLRKLITAVDAAPRRGVRLGALSAAQ